MDSFAKTECAACGQHVEFPVELAGQEIPCPNCGEKLTLENPDGVGGPKKKRPPRKFWLQNEQGGWGPFDWGLPREWFVLGWLPPETLVFEVPDGPWQAAQDVPVLWKPTKALCGTLEGVQDPKLASEQLPVSPALAARLQSLGWPGNPDLLRNYYWANKLRETLEKIIPDANRCLFDDPDWPRCWSWACPAEEVRIKERRRMEAPQRRALVLRAYPPDSSKWGTWNERLHEMDSQKLRQVRGFGIASAGGDDIALASEGLIRGYATSLESCSCPDFEDQQKPCKHIYCQAILAGHPLLVTKKNLSYYRKKFGEDFW